MRSFIVEIWAKIFSILRWISPFQLVRTVVPRTKANYRFVDGWILGNLLLSAALLSICSAPNLRWWEVIAIGYGGIRVFEVFIYQINVLLFDEYRAKKAGKLYALRGYRRIVILLLHNYVEIIFWFALFYRNIDWAFEPSGAGLNSFFRALNFSFVSMSNFGYAAISPIEIVGDIVIFLQSIVGLFMALLILARFISLIPKPKTLDELER